MKARYVLTSLLALTVVFGIVLVVVMFVMMYRNETITLEEGDGVTTAENILSFDARGLKPGDKKPYTIRLKSPVAGRFSVSLVFFEEGEGALKDYVSVTLVCGSEEIEEPLSELLGGKSLDFKCTLGKKAETIKVTFSMDESVENEAQNTVSDFSVNLIAKRII